MRPRLRPLEFALLAVGVGLLAVVAFVTQDEVRQFRRLTATLPRPAQTRDPFVRPPAWSFEPASEVKGMGGFFVAKHPSEIHGLAITRDDLRVATACSGAVVVSSIPTGAEVASFAVDDEILAVAFTVDDTIILAGGRKRLHALDAKTGAEQWMLPIADVTKVVVSPDGATAYVASYDKSIHVVDLAKHHQRAAHYLYQPILALALRPQTGQLAAGLLDGSIALLSSTRFGFRVDARIQAHAKTIDDLAFSPDGTHLASAGDDRMTVVTRLADPPAIEATYASDDQAWGVAYSPDGKLLASASHGWHLALIVTDEQWHAGTRNGMRWTRVAFTHDGRMLLGGSDKTLKGMPIAKRGLGTALPAGPVATDHTDDAIDSVLAHPDSPDAAEKTRALLEAEPTSARARLARARWIVQDACADGRSCDLYSLDDAGPLVDDVKEHDLAWWRARAALLAAREDGWSRHGERDRDEGAAAALREGFVLAPNDADLKLTEALMHLRRGEAATAAEILSAVLAVPQSPGLALAAWRALADAYADAGDIDAAKAAYRKRAELYPRARDALARYLLSVNEPDEAMKVLTREDSTLTRYWATVAVADRALWMLHRPDDALRLYEDALALTPGGAAHYGLAAIAHQRGDDTKAYAELTSAWSQSTGAQHDAFERVRTELQKR